MTHAICRTGADWDFELLERYHTRHRAGRAAEFGLDTYPNQIEIITSEQMLDAYATSGLPVGYPHWSYGKEFIRNEQAYRRGMQGLAYEIVINSDPCIAYLMEENTVTTQALVIAHACYGHNSFFKGNELFRQWTDADAILDYLVFARRYVMECEERHGEAAVEEILDACHALMAHGVDRYRRPAPLTLKEETARLARARSTRSSSSTTCGAPCPRLGEGAAAAGSKHFPDEPQENILYFVEKFSPRLEPWQRELVRIVRKLAQYFYPQAQTKVMNEGWATFWHYTILNRLHEKGQVDDGFMFEFLKSHTNVVYQPSFDSKYYCGHEPVCARLRDVLRPAAHLREARRRGSRLVPGARGQRLAEDARLRHAQLQGRVVHRAVPVAAPDSRVPPVRHRRSPQPRARSSSTASTTTPATAACASCSRSSMRTRSASPTCRSCATTATAIAR